MQPPTIPHKIDNYEASLNASKCLSCHSRNLVEESQAPMVSVTHFMDCDGNFLAEVSPRRYFCQQCHVTQADIKPLVENTFRDVGSMLDTVKQRNQIMVAMVRLVLAVLRSPSAHYSPGFLSLDYMDFTARGVRASDAHETFLASGKKTCIDCHKGIAHELPDMAGVPGWQ